MSESSAESLPPALAAAWGVPAGDVRRGPKPQLDVPTIVQAAIQAADADARPPSLSRVARRLGVTTNALYRYLGSRAELDMLTAEHALGPPPRLTEGDWRAAVRQWATAMRGRHADHPWLAEVQAYVPMLPHILGWLDALLDALITGGMDTPDAMRAASIIDGYVRAVATRERVPARASTGEQTLWYSPVLAERVSQLARESGLTHVADVLSGAVFESSALTGDEEFEAGLDVIIAGLNGR